MSKPNGDRVSGREAVVFFRRSGLPVEQLKIFWRIAAHTSNEFLTREEFFVALRLIAYAQNGINPDESSIQQNIEVTLPKFDVGGPPAPQQMMSNMPPQQQ